MGQSPRGEAPQLPADVPPEHAQAYLTAFRRAYEQASDTEPPVEPDSPREQSLDADDWQDDDSTAPAWLIPLLTIILLAALFAAVYALGR